jgi:hypothetical protein
MKTAMAVLVGLALVVLLSGFTLPMAPPEDCPDECVNVGTISTYGTTCAVAIVTKISERGGTAEEGCSPTCTTCSSRVKIEWDCDSCTVDPCVWVWGNQSYDKNGNELAYGSGSGTGGSEVTQGVTTSCLGPIAQFGVSVAGQLKVYNLQCPCDP